MLIGVLACSEKESEAPIGLKGEIRGKIFLYTEFGQRELTMDGVSLSLKDPETQHEIRTTTDLNGNYTLKDVPIGTYDINVEKQGFSPSTIENLPVIGGKEPLYLNYSLIRPSTSEASNLSLQYVSGSIRMKCTLLHHYTGPSPLVIYLVFIGNTPDVSPEHYLSTSTISTTQSSGTLYEGQVSYNSKQFPSGSTLYAVVYGLTNGNRILIDPDTGFTTYEGLGTVPSNIASIKIP